MRLTANPVPPEDEVGGWLHDFISWYLGEDGFPITERCGALRWFLRGPEDELLWYNSKQEADEALADPELGMSPDARPLSFTLCVRR